MLVLYLFVFDIRDAIRIEKDLKKKLEQESDLDDIKYHLESSDGEKSTLNEPNLNKGNYIRISSVFNGEKKEISDLLNDFSVYGLIDKNIKKAEADNFYNHINTNNSANSQIKTQYYTISYKDRKICFRNKTKRSYLQKGNLHSIKFVEFMVKIFLKFNYLIF